MNQIDHFDVILVGAGISGLGFAHHLKHQCPSKQFLLLESKESFGGTWVTHTYPGIRSDSDLYTFGYGFKPWTGAPIADAKTILNYLSEVIDDDDLDAHIRYQHRICSADWSSSDKRWTLTVTRADTGEDFQISCDFFVWTGGYYDHRQGYTPDWPGFSDYQGEVVHPQTWSPEIDLTDKRVVVIGSGATAATLIPNIADDCAHVTMLQRSPTYFWTGENRNELADRLRGLELPEEWIHEAVRRDLLKSQRDIQYAAEHFPEQVKEELFGVVKSFLGEEMAREHFVPSYRPWQQRIAYVPDGDLFHALKSEKASIVTDHIERFTATGIRLVSGRELEADVVITATGFNMQVIGNLPYTIDGAPIDPVDSFTYRGIMLSDFPNFVQMFGYLRTSWTMRVDLVADYLCRLLNHMDAQGSRVVTPKLRPQDQDMQRRRWISEDEFDPGYIRRGAHLMPGSGDQEPWSFSPDYYVEKDQMPAFDLDEDTLVYQ